MLVSPCSPLIIDEPIPEPYRSSPCLQLTIQSLSVAIDDIRQHHVIRGIRVLHELIALAVRRDPRSKRVTAWLSENCGLEEDRVCRRGRQHECVAGQQSVSLMLRHKRQAEAESTGSMRYRMNHLL